MKLDRPPRSLIFPCTNCKKEDRLTFREFHSGYQCSECAKKINARFDENGGIK